MFDAVISAIVSSPPSSMSLMYAVRYVELTFTHSSCFFPHLYDSQQTSADVSYCATKAACISVPFLPDFVPVSTLSSLAVIAHSPSVPITSTGVWQCHSPAQPVWLNFSTFSLPFSPSRAPPGNRGPLFSFNSSYRTRFSFFLFAYDLSPFSTGSPCSPRLFSSSSESPGENPSMLDQSFSPPRIAGKSYDPTPSSVFRMLRFPLLIVTLPVSWGL